MAWRWLSIALGPAAVAAVTVTGEVPADTVYRQAVVDAQGNIETGGTPHMRREAMPARAVTSESEIVPNEQMTMALNLNSQDASATASKLSSESQVQEAVIEAEKRMDGKLAGKPHVHASQDSTLENPLAALPQQLPQGSVYYFDPEANALSYLGGRAADESGEAILTETPPAQSGTSPEHAEEAKTIWTRRGPLGPPGSRGLTGVKGQPGPRGNPGTDFHNDIDLSESKGKPGPEGPRGPPGDHGVHGDRGPQGPAGVKGAEGNFTKEQELEFASLTRRMATALKRADAMDEMEHLVLTTRLNRLKSHFGYLEKNLTSQEEAAKKQKEIADKKMKDVATINAVTENASAAVAEAQAAEKNLLKREAKLKDEILTITQEQQQRMNAPLPPGYGPAPCPPEKGRRKFYHR